MTETTTTEPTEPTKTINRRSIVKAEQEIRDLIEVENNAIEAGQREIDQKQRDLAIRTERRQGLQMALAAVTSENKGEDQ